VDHVVLLEHFPRFAGKERLGGYQQLPGGQIATALLAATRLGLRASLIGSVGDDEAAQVALAPLREGGVELSGVRIRSRTPTQLSVILVDSTSGERTVLWYRDPQLCLKAAELRRDEVVRGRVLHLDAGDPEAAGWAAQVAREAGIPVVLDADTPGPGLDSLLRRVDFPIVSREFAENQFGTGSVREALGGLVALGARLAVVTLGSVGALAREADREIASPAFAVQARDTTGAGDVFHAGFVWGLLEGLSAERVLGAANGAAALNCCALGAQGGLPTRDDLLSFLASHRPGPWRDPEAASR
jgi:sulfofructose kinase